MISHYFVAFRAFMVGLFHVNSAAFSFLELLSWYQKCSNFPKIGTPLGAALPDPAAGGLRPPSPPPLDPLSPLSLPNRITDLIFSIIFT